MVTRHWGRVLDGSVCSGVSEIEPESSCLHDWACHLLLQSCVVVGRAEEDENGKGAGRSLSCCYDWRVEEVVGQQQGSY